LHKCHCQTQSIAKHLLTMPLAVKQLTFNWST
jgi:hypothetical protein